MLVFKLRARDGHSRRKFTGFHLDQELDLLISLTSISEGYSKSELFRIMVDDYFKKNNSTEAVLIKKVVTRAVAIFNHINGYETTISISDFRKHLKRDLEAKKLPKYIVKSILEKFDGKFE